MALLGDDDPYVRARAAWAIARLVPDRAAVLLEPLLQDRAVARVEVVATTLSGDTRKLRFAGSPLLEVRDAALGALQILSRGTLKLSAPRTKDSLDADARTAVAWIDSRPASP